MRHTDDAPVLRHDTDGVTTLTLNRPERFNALSEEMLEALTATLCAKSAVALRTGKAMFQRQQEMPLSRAYAYAGEMMAANMMVDDVDEGIAAFLAKRRPAWRDRCTARHGCYGNHFRRQDSSPVTGYAGGLGVIDAGEQAVSEGKRRTAGRPASGKTSGGHSQSLVRGLNLLERLAGSPGGLALSEIAEQSELAPSTTHRLLQALQSQGYVTQDNELGVWKIDVKTFRIGNSFLEARDFVGTSRPFLRRLTALTGETANLGVRDGSTAVFLAQSESPQMMRMITRLGSRAPLHASGVGKALMAWLPDDELARVLEERGLARVTTNTLHDPAALDASLAEIRRQGYACDREEHAIGLHCVAACIHNEHGVPLAAISVSGPVARIPETRLTELGELVREAAAEITARLGGRIPQAEELPA